MRQGRRNKGPVVVSETTEEEEAGGEAVANVPAGSFSFRLKPKNIRRVSLVATQAPPLPSAGNLGSSSVVRPFSVTGARNAVK